jgi:LPS export ABC transporter protein LptC
MAQQKSSYSFRLAFLILGCVLTVTACENDQAVVDSLFKKKIAVEEAKNVESYLSQSGRVKARLTGPYMLRYQADSPYLEFPRTLHVDFYNDSTKIESTVDARYGKFVEYDHKVLLRDSVVVINRDRGDTLKTQELWWDQDKHLFYTDKPADMLQADKIIHAQLGIRAAQDLSWYTFYDANGPVLVPNNGGLPK